MNLNNLMMLSLFLILSFVYLTKASTPVMKDSPTLKLSINVQKDNKLYPAKGWSKDQGRVYIFRDGDQTTITCNLKCNGSECYEGHKYSLHLYLHKNDDTYKTVNFTANTTASVSRAFTLHENDTEVVCKAKYHGLQTAGPKNVHLPTPAIVRFQYTQRAPGGEARLLKSPAPQISPGYFKDTGNTFALFTCTAQKEGLALLSWQQMKGSDRIILKTVLPSNLSDDVIHDTLNKTLAESDRDTKLFCAARYFLEGQGHISLSNRTLSKMIVLRFNRTNDSVPQETRVLSFAEWMSIIGAIIVAALIVVTILIAVILKYKRKVKEYARDEEIRNRPAEIPPRGNVYDLKEYKRDEDMRNRPAEIPPTENVYDQVYGHGAGLKRPRVRPADKRH